LVFYSLLLSQFFIQEIDFTKYKLLSAKDSSEVKFEGKKNIQSLELKLPSIDQRAFILQMEENAVIGKSGLGNLKTNLAINLRLERELGSLNVKLSAGVENGILQLIQKEKVIAEAFLNANTGFASGFSTSAAVGGIFKWNGNPLSTDAFTAQQIATASPNPTTGVLELRGTNISQVVVFDVLGKQVLSSNYSSLNNVTLNLASLNNGVYMVKVTNATGNSSTIKVVKQ
jgi:hypothetical protein